LWYKEVYFKASARSPEGRHFSGGHPAVILQTKYVYIKYIASSSFTQSGVVFMARDAFLDGSPFFAQWGFLSQSMG